MIYYVQRFKHLNERSDFMNTKNVEKLRESFICSQKVLQAIGDATRQNIILTLMEAQCGVGMRVGEITKRTHLSRPAVSHHLKILKEANIVYMRKHGTMNFYGIEIGGGLGDLLNLAKHLETFTIDYTNENKENV